MPYLRREPHLRRLERVALWYDNVDAEHPTLVGGVLRALDLSGEVQIVAADGHG